MSDNAIGMCCAAGCRESIWPHEERHLCGCGRELCSSCKKAKVTQCSACLIREHRREAHDLYTPLLKATGEAGIAQRALLTRAFDLMPESDLKREIEAALGIRECATESTQDDTKDGGPIG